MMPGSVLFQWVSVFVQGYLWKKGQLRRNWKERWFTLRPSNLSYYTGEDRKDCQGNIVLDGNCCVEVRSWRIHTAHFSSWNLSQYMILKTRGSQSGGGDSTKVLQDMARRITRWFTDVCLSWLPCFLFFLVNYWKPLPLQDSGKRIHIQPLRQKI